MRNLTVGADSAATVNVTAANGTLREGATPLLDADGAALVVHAGADDYRTDPAGNSGARIACGVVQTR
jgi:Cu-Zn family superoxide dismutase